MHDVHWQSTALSYGHRKGWCAHALTDALYSHECMLLCCVTKGTVVSVT